MRVAYTALLLVLMLGYGFLAGVLYVGLNQQTPGPIDWGRAYTITVDAWTLKEA